MIIHTGAIEVSLRTGPDIVDITGELRGIIQDSGIADGVVLMNVVGSTGSLTTIEYEPGREFVNGLHRLPLEVVGFGGPWTMSSAVVSLTRGSWDILPPRYCFSSSARRV